MGVRSVRWLSNGVLAAEDAVAVEPAAVGARRYPVRRVVVRPCKQSRVADRQAGVSAERAPGGQVRAVRIRPVAPARHLGKRRPAIRRVRHTLAAIAISHEPGAPGGHLFHLHLLRQPVYPPKPNSSTASPDGSGTGTIVRLGPRAPDSESQTWPARPVKLKAE